MKLPEMLVPGVTVPDNGGEMIVLGALAGQPVAGGLKDPGRVRKDANALQVLHRSAVLKAGDDGRVTLDDNWARSWACATRLGQDAPGGLAEHVAARRRAALKSLSTEPGISVVTVVARPMGAVVTGTGAGGIRNVGIELHGTYGWPVLPGTTLKGVARSYARDEEDLPDGMPAALFGGSPGDDEGARAGSVTFLDTLPGPGGITVAEHVLTPHTRGYRISDPDEDGDDVGSGPRPPAEYVNPVPVPFLVLTGGVVHIHLAGPQPEVGQAAGLLARALDDTGLGAKTTSGYGYFEIEKIVPGLPGEGEQ